MFKTKWKHSILKFSLSGTPCNTFLAPPPKIFIFIKLSAQSVELLSLFTHLLVDTRLNIQGPRDCPWMTSLLWWLYYNLKHSIKIIVKEFYRLLKIHYW